ncbi:MAG: zinc metalloprotease HtpX [Nanoarchaeota archaeon]
MFFNQIKTVLLLGILTSIVLLIGAFIGGQQGLTIALVFSVLMNFGAYFFSHKIVLMMYRAQELPKSKAPEIHRMVEEIAHAANIPKPKIYLIPSPHANAFATGPSPKKAVVAVTDGIIKLLTKEELKGVLAHELGHVKNRDILIQTIAATIASVISYLAFMARWAAIVGTGRDDNRGGNPLALLFMVIIAPLAAMIIQLAISRSREYMADERGARLIKNPLPLASALSKLETASKHVPLQFGSPSSSHLFIVKPFRGDGLMSLFSTHPPLQERISRLKAMKI